MLIRRALFPLLLATPLAAQTPTPATPPPSPELQIHSAVLALPVDDRAAATVMGYDAAGKLITLRKGAGEMTCLGHNPKDKNFHVACYHNSMEPFMARGRELRAAGVKDPEVDSVRFREAREGKLALPKMPAAMHQLFGGTLDAPTGEVAGAQVLYVIYIPFSTGKTTGLTEKPSRTAPWIMFPGTPKAHIMFTPRM